MSIANTKDGFYQLHISTTGVSGTFYKVERLIKCSVPSDVKALDDITATDDKRIVKVPVAFKEDSEIEFEYVLLPEDTAHQMIQSSYDAGTQLTFQIRFTEVASESRQFQGIISELTTDAQDTKKKLRKTGKITITSDVIKDLTY